MTELLFQNKPKQKEKIIDFEDALAIFDRVCKQVIDRDGRYRWGKEPQDVVVDLLGKVFIHDGRYVIKYLDASEIMDRAKSSIMIGGINRGIDTIKQVWKRSYIGEV
jgi:hypothetical protein